jgi:CRP-like cAMP-binding protein
MKPCLFLADEYVVKEGTRAENLYFISKKGILEVFIRVTPIPTRKQIEAMEKLSLDEQKKLKEKDFLKIRSLYEGDYFGEVGMVTNLRRTASVRTLNPCHCMKMDKEAFTQLKVDFPHIIDEMRSRIRTYRDQKFL